MKKILLTIIILISAILFAGCSSPNEDIKAANIVDSTDTITKTDLKNTQTKPINLKESSFEFEGYTVGKSHIGTFNEFEGKVHLDKDNNIVGAQGTIIASSVNTGIEGLDTHLKNDDFFDVEKYPIIEVTLLKIENGNAIANLNFHGVQKEIQFPITVNETSINAEFTLDTTPYNIKYTGVNKEVRIKFNFVY